jgi:23S rRNA pseudouridine1911/1915/1917 synthase
MEDAGLPQVRFRCGAGRKGGSGPADSGKAASAWPRAAGATHRLRNWLPNSTLGSRGSGGFIHPAGNMDVMENSAALNNGFGQGEGELLELTYPKPLPMRLDRWLVSQRPEQSRARIQKFIDAGCVRVNGVTGRAKTPLRLGDTVQLWMPPPEALPYLVPQDIPLDVLYEDSHLIVLNKPAGLTVHPAPGNKDGTLVNALLHHCPDLPGIGGEMRPGIVHRLDKDTTGCIVVAKSQEALVRLQAQIQKRIASREYLGLVHGQPRDEAGTIVGAIGRHPVDRKKYAVVSDLSGRHARTHWRVEERLGDHALLRFQLDTGRTHQIRVHCAHIGHPIVGDPLYGRARRLPVALPGQALHAVALGLNHPLTGERMRFESPLPEPFERLLQNLRRRC